MTAGCSHAGDPGLTGELRAVALLALDRLEPVLERVRSGPATAIPPATCAVCPVCAVLAVLRGERPELALRLAEQATGLITALRAALEDEPAQPAPPTPGRTVQYIRVERPERVGRPC